MLIMRQLNILLTGPEVWWLILISSTLQPGAVVRNGCRTNNTNESRHVCSRESRNASRSSYLANQIFSKDLLSGIPTKIFFLECFRKISRCDEQVRLNLNFVRSHVKMIRLAKRLPTNCNLAKTVRVEQFVFSRTFVGLRKYALNSVRQNNFIKAFWRYLRETHTVRCCSVKRLEKSMHTIWWELHMLNIDSRWRNCAFGFRYLPGTFDVWS